MSKVCTNMPEQTGRNLFGERRLTEACVEKLVAAGYDGLSVFGEAFLDKGAGDVDAAIWDLHPAGKLRYGSSKCRFDKSGFSILCKGRPGSTTGIGYVGSFVCAVRGRTCEMVCPKGCTRLPECKSSVHGGSSRRGFVRIPVQTAR